MFKKCMFLLLSPVTITETFFFNLKTQNLFLKLNFLPNTVLFEERSGTKPRNSEPSNSQTVQ